MKENWTNWSKNVSCQPDKIVRPSTLEDIIEIIQEGNRLNKIIRTLGSGHSMSGLCLTNDLLISMENMTAIESIDRKQMQATIQGGAVLKDLGGPLLNAGMSMKNLGDIDKQTIAGAISTGTHGSGHLLGSISTQVIGLRFVTANGEVLECSEDENPDLYKFAQVSLGALGIIAAVRLQLVPAFKLHEKVWMEPIEKVMENLKELIDDNRSSVFFWHPQTDQTELKILNTTDMDPFEKPSSIIQEKVSNQQVFPFHGERAGPSHLIFPFEPSDEGVNEMEYSIPAENGPACFQEIRNLVQNQYPEEDWPIEYRTLAADDIPLSTAYKRQTVTISIHRDYRDPYRDYFSDTETIFKKYNGRPHWGKIHFRNANELKALYPQWNDFQKLRKALDPQNRFLNDHLKTILG